MELSLDILNSIIRVKSGSVDSTDIVLSALNIVKGTIESGTHQGYEFQRAVADIKLHIAPPETYSIYLLAQKIFTSLDTEETEPAHSIKHRRNEFYKAYGAYELVTTDITNTVSSSTFMLM